jgi:hypothetical protein
MQEFLQDSSSDSEVSNECRKTPLFKELDESKKSFKDIEESSVDSEQIDTQSLSLLGETQT